MGRARDQTTGDPPAGAPPVIRREFIPADADAIVELHDRVYRAEYGLDARFAASVAWSVESALARGWPQRGGAVWLVELGGELSGSLALVDEGDGVGRVRWFVLVPELRGHGLGRRLLAELVSEAGIAGLRLLGLETFSALTAASRLYRDVGFRLVSERETDAWGPPIIYQRYERELR